MKILILAAMLVLVPFAAAQEDACTQDNPCPWTINVDEDGLQDTSLDVMTVNDWFLVTVHNDDLGNAHTVTLEGYDVKITVQAFGDGEKLVQLGKTGTFSILDDPSGTTLQFQVITGDAVDYENGVADESGNAIKSGKGTPGFEFVAGLAALAAVLLLARRCQV